MHTIQRRKFTSSCAALAAAVIGIPVLLVSHARAQQAVTAPPGNPSAQPGTNTEATTERVFVTGSIIPTAAEVGPNPVITATRDLINKIGDRTTEEILRNLPIANA